MRLRSSSVLQMRKEVWEWLIANGWVAELGFEPRFCQTAAWDFDDSTHFLPGAQPGCPAGADGKRMQEVGGPQQPAWWASRPPSSSLPQTHRLASNWTLGPWILGWGVGLMFWRPPFLSSFPKMVSLLLKTHVLNHCSHSPFSWGEVVGKNIFIRGCLSISSNDIIHVYVCVIHMHINVSVCGYTCAHTHKHVL